MTEKVKIEAHWPSSWSILKEAAHLGHILPREICRDEFNVQLLESKYPDLYGDRTTFDEGDNIPLWRNPGWYVQVLRDYCPSTQPPLLMKIPGVSRALGLPRIY